MVGGEPEADKPTIRQSDKPNEVRVVHEGALRNVNLDVIRERGSWRYRPRSGKYLS